MNPTTSYSLQIKGLVRAAYCDEDCTLALQFTDITTRIDFEKILASYMQNSQYPTLEGASFHPVIYTIRPNANVPEEWRVRSVHEIFSFIAGEAFCKEASKAKLIKIIPDSLHFQFS